MNEKQKAAIKAHMKALTEAFPPSSIHSFFTSLELANVINHDEKQVIRSNVTSTQMLIDLFKLLQQKDNAWSTIITQLIQNDQSVLAETLRVTADEVMTNTSRHLPSETPISDKPGVDFKVKLVDYYKTEYSRVPTVFGHSKPIDDVWVPLQIEDDTKFPIVCKKQLGFDHVELLKRLEDPKNPYVALVKGHPGLGKTTLVKKIAYDWANGNLDHYFLVLAVPLRHVDSAEDLLRMAVDYYTQKFCLSPAAQSELFNAAMQLGRKLLICFDGLDEYGKFAESPFNMLFGSQFGSSEQTWSPSSPSALTCQLLITSRPYACDRIKQDFYPLRFEILPLNDANLDEFVRLYCATKQAMAKVTKYLKANAKLVIKIPLILTFVCFLADTNEKIPTKLTLLYDRLLSLMIWRETNGNKRIEETTLDNWKNSSFLKPTLQLAFYGCKEYKFEFSQSIQKDLGVNKNSFTCGFLLQKFDFSEGRLTAEFPHRSIQEFFAAVHCYRLIFTTDKNEKKAIVKEIFKRDSQFGRFFFGICSKEKKFQKMLDWLNPTFDDAEIIESWSFDPSHLLYLLSISLSDCLEPEVKLLAQRVLTSLKQLEKKIKTERKRKVELLPQDLSSLNTSFQSDLNLNFLDEDRILSWSLSQVDEPKWSLLTYVAFRLPVHLQEKFEKIQIFMWGMYDLAGMISSLDRLPPISTLIVQPGSYVDVEVNFDLNYEIAITTTATSLATQLRHFTFGFKKDCIPSWKGLFSGQLDTDDLIIGETRKTGEKAEINWLTVRVRRSLDQSQLVRILVELALEIAVIPLETKRNEKNCSLM